MKKISMMMILIVMMTVSMFACEMKYITSFAGSSSEYKIKDKCAVVRKETDKIVLPIGHDKDVVCLGKVEENGSVIMTYDDAGITKKIIFKRCNKDKMRNKLYCMYLIGLYDERSVF